MSNLKQISTTSMQCTYQVLWKSTDMYISYHPEMKIRTCRGQVTLSKIDEICPSTIQNQTFIISMYTPNLVKFHWRLLKLSSGYETSDITRSDNCKNGETCQLTISNQISTISINTHQVCWKSIDIYSSYHPKTTLRTDGRATEGRPDGRTDTRTATWYHNTPPLSCNGISKCDF